MLGVVEQFRIRDELIDRMTAAIGEPATDSHGAPIPTREGTLHERTVVPLSSLDVGTSARVERVGDRDPQRLRYLAELGIVPGAAIQVIAHAPFNGPIAVRVATEERTIGHELASQILVASRASRRPRSAR